MTVYHKPWNTIKHAVVNPKDKVEKFKRRGIIYQITSDDCESVYIWVTKRTMKIRFKEQLRQTPPLTAVGQHKLEKGHKFPQDNVKILDSEEHWLRRRVKEALF